MNNWYNNAIIYHIYPLGFCGAPKFNEGGAVEYRLDKIIDWIPHFKEMNVDALYLGPIFESVEHGYDTIDYKMIDRRLGDNESFKKLVLTVFSITLEEDLQNLRTFRKKDSLHLTADGSIILISADQVPAEIISGMKAGTDTIIW